jgi:alkylation response protein AidB-like acyl-CoA dehydrogenase
MDIEFTEEQKILQESIERMLRANYDFDKRQEIVASEQGYSRVLWQKFADLGLLAASSAEEVGGLGGGPIATMIIMEAFGRHLVVEPVFESVVLAGGLIEAIGSEKQREDLLGGIVRAGPLGPWLCSKPNLAMIFTQLRQPPNANPTPMCCAAQKRWWLPRHGLTGSSFPPAHRDVRATETV